MDYTERDFVVLAALGIERAGRPIVLRPGPAARAWQDAHPLRTDGQRAVVVLNIGCGTPDAAPKRGREHSKQALVIEMLKRPEGATIAQICEATSWQAHTTRGFFAGTVKKKLGLAIVSEKIEGPSGTPGAGQRLYRIAEEASA
ncbi:MAG: DUF3489 domain-containing protein [Rhodoferax sp.]|nr:DUF3489 domain-containing protein [Rhodoferax sp.]